MVALAASRFHVEGIGGVDLRCCTVSDLADEPRFDGALLCFVLHFIPDDGSKDRLLEQIARRLKPGAELVLLDFCRTGDPTRDLSALRVYLDWFSRMGAADRDAYLTRLQQELHLLPADAYPDRARRAGFTGARPFHASLHVGGWILERA